MYFSHFFQLPELSLDGISLSDETEEGLFCQGVTVSFTDAALWQLRLDSMNVFVYFD